MMAELDKLAQAHGLALTFIGENGEERVASDEAKRSLLSALGVPATTDEEVRSSLGSAAAHDRHSDDIGAVPRCYLPPWAEDARLWGITCQLYGLRSNRNWGIGDFEDLAQLAEVAASTGADFIGISPLHALFSAEPRRFSPYAPSSRLFLNPLYIALDWPAEDSQLGHEALQAIRDDELVNYEAVARLKYRALDTLYKRFRDHTLENRTEDQAAFTEFCRRHGRMLEDFALFEALSEYFVALGQSCGWHGWPREFQDKNSAAVRSFASQNQERIAYHMWLQWMAHSQLSAAQKRALTAGMRVGLYLDLAVGVASDGADTWCQPDAVLSGVRIGSPPDAFNPSGQDWGLAPLSPTMMRRDDGHLFRQIVLQAMQLGGAVRFDHAMALMRLYLIPDGLPSSDGAYVHYPLEKLLNVLASASQETKAIVIGEDLGTVPPNFRDIMRQAKMQGYRVLFFEREWNGNFRRPEHYDRDALACISTHDLPTLRGWWGGHDIDDREALGIDDAEAATSRAARASERRLLIAALADAHLLPDELSAVARGEAAIPEALSLDLAIALTRYLARTPCRLVAIQLEDLAQMRDRANLPGTIDEHPNWRRKLPLTLEQLAQSSAFSAITQAIAEERPNARDQT